MMKYDHFVWSWLGKKVSKRTPQKFLNELSVGMGEGARGVYSELKYFPRHLVLRLDLLRYIFTGFLKTRKGFKFRGNDGYLQKQYNYLLSQKITIIY